MFPILSNNEALLILKFNASFYFKRSKINAWNCILIEQWRHILALKVLILHSMISRRQFLLKKLQLGTKKYVPFHLEVLFCIWHCQWKIYESSNISTIVWTCLQLIKTKLNYVKKEFIFQLAAHPFSESSSQWEIFAKFGAR